ncbi:MAG: DUF1573 domain-containing protein [Chthoniobacter sp.]|nr:DUF1573 domain-containing protein [Chthoniobacter sp.]
MNHLALAGELSADVSEHDFGVITPDSSGVVPQTLFHKFLVKNTGGAAVEIKEIKTSCSCTSAIPSSHTVEAGGQISITTEVDLRSRRGRIEASMLVIPADGKPVELNIHAFLAGSPLSSPTELNVQRFTGEETEVEFEVSRGAIAAIPADEHITFLTDLKGCVFTLVDRNISQTPGDFGIYGATYHAKCVVAASEVGLMKSSCDVFANEHKLLSIPINVETLALIALKKTKLYAGSGSLGEKLPVSARVVSKENINISRVVLGETPVEFSCKTIDSHTVLISFSVSPAAEGLFSQKGYIEIARSEEKLQFEVFGVGSK